MDRFQILKNSEAKSCYAPLLNMPSGKGKIFTNVTQENYIPRSELAGINLEVPAGRARFTHQIVHALSEDLERQSIARRIFSVDRLEAGEMAFYEKGHTPVYCYQSNGGEFSNIATIPESIARVIVPTSYIPSENRIPLSHLRLDNTENLALHVRNNAFQEIIGREQSLAIVLLDEVALRSHKILETPLLDNLELLRGTLLRALEIQNNTATIFMNAQQYVLMRHFGRDELDVERSRDLLQIGIMAHFRGAMIIVSRNIPAGNIYLTAVPEAVGYLPIREDVTAIYQDDPVNAE